MEIKDYIHITVEKDERSYRFEIPVGATFGAATDACYQCIEAIVDLQKQALEKHKADNKTDEDVQKEEKK